MILLQLCIYTLSLQLPFTFYIYSKQTNKHKAKFCFSLFFISSGVIIVDLDFKLPSDLVPFWICFGYSHTVATSTLPTLTWFPPLFFSTVVLYETKGQQARQKWCAQPATLHCACAWPWCERVPCWAEGEHGSWPDENLKLGPPADPSRQGIPPHGQEEGWGDTAGCSPQS